MTVHPDDNGGPDGEHWPANPPRWSGVAAVALALITAGAMYLIGLAVGFDAGRRDAQADTRDFVTSAEKARRAASHRADLEYARGRSDGYEAFTAETARQLRGLKTAVNTIADGCVYMPGAHRLGVHPVQAQNRR